MSEAVYSLALLVILSGANSASQEQPFPSVRQTLAGAGHAVDYIEVPEGHNRATWRNHMGKVLISLFGTRTKLARLAPRPDAHVSGATGQRDSRISRLG